ncbi:class I SAM-dependent methyltransferase [Vibrio sp. MEBiC08052]|uniref:class I SAM-dependent methyltransferase n=1 Tax=Vibrio sp. MEBiC08052 TaxID=1761910 RepID=UPI0007405D15|nr:class I SAM-dependent methyltransferase [Vibrio sp. MEBiC08052]KUI99469.1 hypothetical protein VRK_15530 [Vibrio sp. MEBiC08052]
MNLHELPREIKNKSNFPFWFSLIKEARNIFDFSSDAKILDFGCGTAGFLQLLNFILPGRVLTGVEIDNDLIAKCQANHTANFSFITYQNFSSLPDGEFDVVFSQEVIYTLPDIALHAEEMFRVLREGGYYIASMGCHIENPTWAHRRSNIRSSEKYYAYDYTLDEVAKAFYNVGFRVSVKRLPVHAPLKVSFDEYSEFRSINDLLLSSYHHKIMFIFLKPKHLL